MRRGYTAVKDEVDAMPSPANLVQRRRYPGKLGGFRLRSLFTTSSSSPATSPRAEQEMLCRTLITVAMRPGLLNTIFLSAV